MDTLLTIVTKFCQRRGLPVPTAVMASTDPQVIQIRTLLEEVGADLARRFTWQTLTRSMTHTSLAAASQGNIHTLTGDSFLSFVKDTFWNSTDRRRIEGPLNSEQWQQAQVFTPLGTGVDYYYIEGDLLYITPTPSAGKTYIAKWKSKNWILATNGSTQKYAFTVDTDYPRFDDELMRQGLMVKWLEAKGLPYAEAMQTFEEMAKNLSSVDGTKPTLDMSGSALDIRPGIFVPSGSWSL